MNSGSKTVEELLLKVVAIVGPLLMQMLIIKVVEVQQYLLEGELDGLVLAQLQDVHQLHD